MCVTHPHAVKSNVHQLVMGELVWGRTDTGVILSDGDTRPRLALFGGGGGAIQTRASRPFAETFRSSGSPTRTTIAIDVQRVFLSSACEMASDEV